MRLLIIRHAIAVPRGSPEHPDPERPLTERGAERFRRAAAGLSSILPAPEAILTSPWVRARQTAEIAARAWGGPDPEEVAALAEWDLDALQGRLDRFGAEETIAIVGHEPDLSSLLALLVGSPHAERVEFRKGGAALVEVQGRLDQGGLLLWHLPPRILRRLARS